MTTLKANPRSEPCDDFEEILEFGGYAPLACDGGYMFRAVDRVHITLGAPPDGCYRSTSYTDAEGYDLFHNKVYVCRTSTYDEGVFILRSIEQDTNLIPIFQIHNS